MKKTDLINELQEILDYSRDDYSNKSDVEENLVCLIKQLKKEGITPIQEYRVSIEGTWEEVVEADSREQAVEFFITKVLEGKLSGAMCQVYENDGSFQDQDTYWLNSQGIAGREVSQKEMDREER